VVFFPLDQQLELWEKHWSEAVAQQAVWLSGLLPFEKAEEVLRRVGQINISVNSVWRQTQKWGERFGAIEATERALVQALPSKRDLRHLDIQSVGRRGVSMDGSMIHIRGEGYKELKVGCVFEIEVRPTRDRKTGEMVGLAHAVNNSYRAHLGGPEIFGQMMWAEAKRRGWEQALDTQVIGDGAPWIWNLALDHFYDASQLVDWYHASEHLATAARLLKGEDNPAMKRWRNARETQLFQGHAHRIAQELSDAAQQQPSIAKELHREAGYFYNNQRRMNYHETRELGWPIGSGMVESGAKQFKARFSGAGMRWSRPGAQRLIPVRAAILSRRFDEFWRLAYSSPQN
jgi:hypothetical protein